MNLEQFKTIKTIALATGLDRDILGACVLENIPYRIVCEQDRINFKQALYTYARHELGWRGWLENNHDPWLAIGVKPMANIYKPLGFNRCDRVWDGKNWVKAKLEPVELDETADFTPKHESYIQQLINRVRFW